MDHFFRDFYDNLFEDFINIPLSSFRRNPENINLIRTYSATDLSRNLNVTQAMDLNQQVINNMINIRRNIQNMNRQLEEQNIQTQNSLLHPYNRLTNMLNDLYNINVDIEIEGNPNLNNNTFFTNIFDFIQDIYNDNPNFEFEDVKVVLSDEEFNKLKKETIDENNLDNYKEISCNICLSDYELREEILRLPCNHCFHKECISNWLQKENVKCPMCRKDCRDNNNKNDKKDIINDNVSDHN